MTPEEFSARLGVGIRTVPGTERRIADAVGRRMARNIRSHTPVDAEGPHPGQLRASVRARSSRQIAPGLWEARVQTEVDYARLVEFDTAPHEIRPKTKQALYWVDHNGEHFAKRVFHPGTTGAHMFAKGAAQTAPQIEEIAQPILERWFAEWLGTT